MAPEKRKSVSVFILVNTGFSDSSKPASLAFISKPNVPISGSAIC